MGVSIKPAFNRDEKVKNNNPHSIYLRVTIDRDSRYLNPKLPKVSKNYWQNKANKWVRDSHPNHFLFNKKIQKKLEDTIDYINRLELQDNIVTHQKILEHFERRGDKTLFNDYVTEYNRTYKFQAVTTKKKYLTFANLLDEFNPHIKFTNIDEALLLDFRDFLIKQKKHKGSTADKYFDPFKKITKDAVRRDYLSKDPFQYIDLGIKKEEPQRTALTQEEIKALLKHKFNANEKHLETNRDVFIFQCYTGLYYNDVKCLSEESFTLHKGKMFLEGNRQKNDNSFIVPLHRFPEAISILEKYKGQPEEILPTISEPAYNRSLKEIAKKAGIAKNISNKTGRHSFADLLADMGLPETHMKKMLGHKKDSNATKNYFELTKDSFM